MSIDVDTHHRSFSSKKKSNKKVIAQKPLTNLYEMNINKHFINTAPAKYPQNRVVTFFLSNAYLKYISELRLAYIFPPEKTTNANV